MTKEYIDSVLTSIGMQPWQLGFVYISDCMEFIDRHNALINDLSKLYLLVGRLHYANAGYVEKAIRNTLSFTRNRCGDYYDVEKYLGFNKTDNFSSISRLYNTLNSEFDQKNDAMLERMLNRVLSDTNSGSRQIVS